MRRVAKRVTLAVCGIALGAMCLSGCGRKQPDRELVLRVAAENVNAMSPVEVDEITRLDSASYVLPATLRYHYTLAIDSLSEAEHADMKAYMRSTLPGRLRAEKAMADMAKLEVTLLYLYNNPSGEPLLEVAIAPAEYAPTEE